MVNINKIVGKVASSCAGGFKPVHIRASVPDEVSEISSSGISKEYSQASTNYGKALVQKLEDKFDSDGIIDREFGIKRLRKLFSKTRPNDTISIEEGVKEINALNIPENDKVKILTSCFFDKEGNEQVMSKPAVYMAKYAVLDNGGEVPKFLDSAIKTSMINETSTFSDDIFYEIYNDYWGIRKGSPLRISSLGRPKSSFMNMERKSLIYEELQKIKNEDLKKVKVKVSDIFTPVEDTAAGISTKLDELVKEGENIPPDLLKSMKDSISKLNFDLEKVFTDHYSLLKECKTLDEVKGFYPELTFPDKKPNYDPASAEWTLSNRLANSDFDTSVIEALKKLYLELLPNTKAFVHIEGSTATNVQNMKRAGFNFSEPSDKLLSFFTDCKKSKIILEKISKMSDETLDPHIKRHALRTSGVWNDYNQITSNGEWMPIRFIKNKRMYPEKTKYSTESLIDTYLFSLYMKNPHAEYAKNPLSRFDNIRQLNDRMKGIISKTFMIRYKTEDKSLPVNMDYKTFYKNHAQGFREFKKQFDLSAMAKSFEHMEDVYHRTFFRKYWTTEKLNSLQNQLQKSYDLAFEKTIWAEQVKAHKQVNIEDAKSLVKDSEGLADQGTSAVKLIDENRFNNYKHLLSSIGDTQLRQRFQSAISHGQKSDEQYFTTFENILNQSLTKDGTIDTTKAEALINIHDSYLGEVMKGTENVTEAEYTHKFLSNYKKKDGSFDYKSIVADTKAESTYNLFAERLIEEGDTEFLTVLDGRFGQDYKGFNSVVEKYLATPEEFRAKFRSIYAQDLPNSILESDMISFFEKIKSWNFEQDEYMIMDADKIPQKIVVTKEAKKDLWEETGKNYETFDEIIKKMYNSGKKRTGDENGTGIKTYTGGEHEAELKILGKHGKYRIYADKITPEEKAKYGDDIKYVFKIVGEH